MRCGIPLLGNRVAPRCRCADGVLIVVSTRNRGSSHQWVPLEITNPLDLTAILRQYRVDTVVCGGISREERETLLSCAPTVIDNVACSVDEALAALEDGALRPGFGFGADRTPEPRPGPRFDCLGCRDRKCLRGEPCIPSLRNVAAVVPPRDMKMLEAATDVSSENERKLCRLAEVVYFGLEMGYRKIGIAYCLDLQEPAEILAGVLARSFDVVALCCKIGGVPRPEAVRPADVAATTSGIPPVSCNPVAQARLLNRADTDLNVIVGLCMGADCVFTRESEAPVTTLFVKDKSLANNPIGAVYSEYYLRESSTRQEDVS